MSPAVDQADGGRRFRCSPQSLEIPKGRCTSTISCQQGWPPVGRLWLPRGIVIPAWQGDTIWYIKVRRPQPGDALARGIEQVGFLPGMKYAHVRGGKSALYGANAMRGLPALLLAEGEFDTLLAWQLAGDLADVATLGSATQRPNGVAAQALRRARRTLVAYDTDPAGA